MPTLQHAAQVFAAHSTLRLASAQPIHCTELRRHAAPALCAWLNGREGPVPSAAAAVLFETAAQEQIYAECSALGVGSDCNAISQYEETMDGGPNTTPEHADVCSDLAASSCWGRW